MTPRQQRFVDEFVVDQDPVAAYHRAGYRGRGRSAQNAANRLLQNVGIRTAIDAILTQRQQEILSATEGASRRLEPDFGGALPAVKEEAIKINAKLLMKEAGAIAFSDIGDVFDFTGAFPKLKPLGQIPEYARRAIAVLKAKRYVEGRGDDAREVELIELKFWDKLAALEKLMKVFGLGREPAPLQDILTTLHEINPVFADEVRRYLIEKRIFRRNGVPPPEPSNN